MSLKASYFQAGKAPVLLDVVKRGPDGSVKPVTSVGSLAAGGLVDLANNQGVLVVTGCPVSDGGEDGTAKLVIPAPVRTPAKAKGAGAPAPVVNEEKAEGPGETGEGSDAENGETDADGEG